jgi:hypothetical protein
MNYLLGFLTTTALLLLEHIALYTPLRPRAYDDEDMVDRKVIAKLIIGVGAILVGCAVVRVLEPTADPFLTPLACSAGGLAIAVAYLFRAAVRAAWARGWLTGLADKGDIADEPAREHDARHT